MTENPLLTVFQELEAVARERGIKFVIMGGMATSIYIEPRATFDIDGIAAITDEAIPGFLEALEEKGFFSDSKNPVKVINGLSFITLYYSPAKLYVDIFLARNEFQKQIMERARSAEIDDLQLEIISPEDLIIVKLISGRPRDTEDVRRILAENKGSLDFDYLQKWAGRLGVSIFLDDEVRSLGIEGPPVT